MDWSVIIGSILSSAVVATMISLFGNAWLARKERIFQAKKECYSEVIPFLRMVTATENKLQFHPQLMAWKAKTELWGTRDIVDAYEEVRETFQEIIVNQANPNIEIIRAELNIKDNRQSDQSSLLDKAYLQNYKIECLVYLMQKDLGLEAYKPQKPSASNFQNE